MNLSKARATADRMPIWLQQAFDRMLDALAIILDTIQVGTASAVNLTALSAVNDNDIQDGSTSFVRSVRDTFVLDKTDTTSVIDGITVVATLSGTGRWLRMLQPDAAWSSQATWYVNATTGNDENSGAAADEQLATFAEFRRRVEPNGVKVVMAVEIQTDLPATDLVGVDTFGEIVVISGVPTTQYTGEVTVFTARTATTGALVRDAGWTVADHLRRFIRFTSGDADGMGAWILADMGSNDARVSCIAEDNLGFELVDVPSAGDTFVVQTYPVVTFQTEQRYRGMIQYRNLTNHSPEYIVWAFAEGEAWFAGCSELNLAAYTATSQVFNCLGELTAYSGMMLVNTGAYGSFFADYKGYFYAINDYVTLDVGLQIYGGGYEAITMFGPGSSMYTTEDVDMYGDFGNWAMYLDAYTQIVFGSGSLWNGDITGTTRQGRMYDGASVWTQTYTHGVTGFTDGFWMYPDAVKVEINEGPIMLPGSHTQVGTGTNYGCTGPMRAGVKGALTIGTRYALPDFTEGTAVTDIPQLVASNSVARNLRGSLEVAPGGADTVVVTVMINGVASALAMTFTGTDVVAADTVDNIIVNPGDKIAFRVVKSGALASGLTLTLEVG